MSYLEGVVGSSIGEATSVEGEIAKWLLFEAGK